jgi:hypothetical protein
MKESGYVDAEVDGVMDKLATEIDATGTLNGQNIPLEAVRSLSTSSSAISFVRLPSAIIRMTSTWRGESR